MLSTRRRSLCLSLFVFYCVMVGGLLCLLVPGIAAASHADELNASLKEFTKVYSVVEANSAERVDPDEAIYRGAITNMLRTLDPHSSFFDPKSYQLLQEDQRGHYYGVGMLVGGRAGRVVVMYPFPLSPAAKAGIRPGDVISAINGASAAGFSTSDVADRLKGPRGSKVDVSILREGNDEPLKFSITRDDIPRSSVQKAFRIRSNIAYLRIEHFNENTSKEVEQNLKRVGEETLEGLVLDLRGNPGGILNEGVAVADRFLRRGQMVVSHRGRSSPERPYVSKRGNTGRAYPIVVLVDRASASASEIVAGALQDHDRAWIVGENTFGKGLVQSQFPLSENAALLLTTAKYYTPSGRLIQKDYSHGSVIEYYSRKDSNKNPTDVRMTDSGRTVFGGGGIAPDEGWQPVVLNAFQTVLSRRDAFFNFTAHYFGRRDATLPKNWAPDEDLLNQFHEWLLKKKYEFTEAEFTMNHEWIRSRLKLEMWLTAFGKEEADRLSVEQDPQVARGIESLTKAKALVESAKGVLARRAAPQTGRQTAVVR